MKKGFYKSKILGKNCEVCPLEQTPCSSGVLCCIEDAASWFRLKKGFYKSKILGKNCEVCPLEQTPCSSGVLGCIEDAAREVMMKVCDLIQDESFKVLNEGNISEREISVPYCCDLLSVAMGRMPADSAWVTVMGNVNTLAVAALADAACIILAEGSHLDESALSKAKQQEITVLTTELPIFSAALIIYQKLHA